MKHLKIVATVAVAHGVAAGSYGIASAAGTSGSSPSSSRPAVTSAAQQQGAPQGWGTQRSDETLLTGDTAAKVRAAAVTKEPGATVSRVETDADGNAAYEVHMITTDGSPVTVYVDKQFQVVGVQSGMPAGPQSAPRPAPTA